MTQEDFKARIRSIVERSWSKHNCKLCGFNRATGGFHPFGGVYGSSRAETRWCNGRKIYEPKSGPNQFEWECPVCYQILFYTHSEISIAVENGKCHECQDKGRTEIEKLL